MRCLIHLLGWEDFQERNSMLWQQWEKQRVGHVLERGHSVYTSWEVRELVCLWGK